METTTQARLEHCRHGANQNSPGGLDWRARDVFRWILEGTLKIRIDKVYPLAEAASAHRDLEGRKTTGKLLLQV